MSLQQLKCPVCHQQYEQHNPPRLLTMCGHTFCHKCIRSFVTKKKQKGYKIKCPIDHNMIEVQKPTPDLFPKNIILLKLFDKRKSVLNDLEEENQFLNHEVNVNQCKIMNMEGQKNEINEQTLIEVCQIHKKPLQLFCIQDCVKTCTDCVIFGDHRLHKVQSILKLQKQQNLCCNELNKIMKLKKQVEKKMSNKQIQNQVLDLLDNKKSLILKQIQNIFIEIREIVNNEEKKLIDSLEINAMQVAHRIKRKMRIQKCVDQQFTEWENKSNQINHSSLVQIVKNKFYKNIIEDGMTILKCIQMQQKKLIQSIQSQIQQLRIEKDFKLLQNQLTKCVQIKHHTIEPQQKLSKQNFNIQSPKTPIKSVKSISKSKSKSKKKIQEKTLQLEEEQSLLDFDNTSKLLLQSKISFSEMQAPSLLCQSRLSTSSDHKVLSKTLKSSSVFNNKATKQPLREKNNPNLSSVKVDKKKSLSVSSSSLSRSRSQSNIPGQKSSTMIKEFHPKYINLMKQLSESKLNSLDLSSCEFRKENILSLIKTIQKHQNLKTIKLMRNNFDDRFIEEIVEYLLQFQRVNLAQNKLSQECLVSILSGMKKCKKNVNMKYLNYGQNRVVERKNNKLVEQYKKFGVTLVL